MTRRSFGSDETTSPPSSVTMTRSSIRTPIAPGTYTPGSTVTTLPACSASSPCLASRGPSWTSSPTPWPRPWPKCSAWPASSMTLRAQHEVVDIAVARVDLAAGPERARAVARVAVEHPAPVDHAERARLDRHVARGGVRQRPVRAARHDRRERHRLGAHAAHRELEVERDLALGASG